jgi:hypothetical protein
MLRCARGDDSIERALRHERAKAREFIASRFCRARATAARRRFAR